MPDIRWAESGTPRRKRGLIRGSANGGPIACGVAAPRRRNVTAGADA